MAETVMPALTSQIVYLLLETNNGDTRHQWLNFRRAMTLILKLPRDAAFHDLYCELANALQIRIESSRPEGKGIEMSPAAAMLWLKRLTEHAGI